MPPWWRYSPNSLAVNELIINGTISDKPDVSSTIMTTKETVIRVAPPKNAQAPTSA